MDDRISNLPDALICDILSFLPTKQSVATSVLSKRWIPLWRSVPTLDFEKSDHYHSRIIEDNDRFIQSVYAFIHSRDQHQSLQKFCLSLSKPPSDPTNLTVVQHRLEQLDISFPWNSPIPPPTISPVIFISCSTNLVVLKLKGLSLKPLSYFDFPLLKTLHLQDLLFLEYECLALLLSRCPLVQDFKAKDLFFTYHLPDGNHKTLPVQFLHIRQINKRVLHHDESRYHSVFPLFHNFTQIELSYTMCNKDFHNMKEVLKYCPQLQVLGVTQQHDLHHETAQFEFELGNMQCPPAVPDCIKLHLKRCYINDYRGTKCEFQLARYIMQKGRVLKSMTTCFCRSPNLRRNVKNFRQLSSCTRRSATCVFSIQ